MKRMIAGLILGLTCAVCVPARSQNLLGRVDTYNVGAPNFNMNSGGTNYGQLFSDGTASKWSLGYNTSLTASGSACLTWAVPTGTTGLIAVGTQTLGNAAAVIASTSTTTSSLLAQVSAGTAALEVKSDGGTIIQVRTKAALQALAPAAAGETFTCSDCAIVYSLVTATGTSAGNFVSQGQTLFR